MPQSLREFFEPRFGHDFSNVRVHTDTPAAESAQAMRALAYTVGPRIVFGKGQYSPRTGAGQRVIAHELAHVIQQRNAPRATAAHRLSVQPHHRAGPPLVMRQVSPVMCSPGKILSVNIDSYRARAMLLNASIKLGAYAASFGLWPAGVRAALSRHFGTTLPSFANILGIAAAGMAALTQALSMSTAYVCRATGSWPCSPRTIAWVPWCLPGQPIVLCDPAYFSQTPLERSTTLIHEWAHKFWCRLDIGYEHEPGYPRNLFTASLNADNFANVVRDVQ